VSRELNTIIGAQNTPMIFAIQFRKFQMLILYLIVELSSMESKIADVPFRTRYRITAATTPLAFHCYLALDSSTTISFL